MKKEKKETRLYKIYRETPLFWKTCIDCGEEYKREEMWIFEILSNAWKTKRGNLITWGGTPREFFYLCKHCCPTETEAISRLDNGCTFA